MPERYRPSPLLLMGILSEMAIVLVGLVVEWFAPIDPAADPLRTSLWHGSASSVLWGIVGAIPLFAFFLVCDRYPVGPLKEIKRFLAEMLGPSLLKCRWFELVVIASLAGFCEEFMFRGVLQPRIGLVGSNVLFGLVHPVTWAYAVIVFVLGMYLGAIFDFSGNLWTPIVAHGLYDYLAFLVVMRNLRQVGQAFLLDRARQDQPDADGIDVGSEA